MVLGSGGDQIILEGKGLRWDCYKDGRFKGRLGGSVVKCLPSAQVMIPAFWDRAPLWAPCSAGSLLLPLSLPLLVFPLSLPLSLSNK